MKLHGNAYYAAAHLDRLGDVTCRKHLRDAVNRLLTRCCNSADAETNLPENTGDGERRDVRESSGIQTTDAQSRIVLAALTESVRRFGVHCVAHVLKEVDGMENAPNIHHILLTQKRDPMSHTVPIVLKVRIGRVCDKGDRARLAGFEKTLLGHLEERANPIGPVFHLLNGSHARQPRNSASTVQTHEERLNLVISVVSYDNLLGVIGFTDLMQQSIALLSALLFELAVLKRHAEPILAEVPKYCDEYTEAHRLIKFLQYFEPIPEKEIPPTSLLREFVGGSSFHY